MANAGGTLVIVPCGRAKIWDRLPQAGPTAARNAYTGAPFKVNREYAERFGDDWVVLSAKYGFLAPDDLIEGPYNVTFKQPATGPIEMADLRRQLSRLRLERFSRVIALGGRDYQRPIETVFRNSGIEVLFPFAGLSLGVSMSAVKGAVRDGRPLR